MTDTTPRRAHSLKEMAEIQGRIFSPEAIGAGIAAWRPEPTDVVISLKSKTEFLSVERNGTLISRISVILICLLDRLQLGQLFTG